MSRATISSDHITQYKTISGTPTLSDLPVGSYMMFREEISGELQLWGNDGSIKRYVERPYKVYTAILTQTGTNPPVPIVLEDTIGIDAEDYTRLDVGKYRITKVGAFPPIKTWLKSDTVRNVEEGYIDRGVYLQNSFSSGFYTSPDSIDITIGDANGLAEEDAVDLSFRGQIEIRVYN